MSEQHFQLKPETANTGSQGTAVFSLNTDCRITSGRWARFLSLYWQFSWSASTPCVQPPGPWRHFPWGSLQIHQGNKIHLKIPVSSLSGPLSDHPSIATLIYFGKTLMQLAKTSLQWNQASQSVQLQNWTVLMTCDSLSTMSRHSM